jgi:PAS domain S-box-containing protein
MTDPTELRGGLQTRSTPRLAADHGDGAGGASDRGRRSRLLGPHGLELRLDSREAIVGSRRTELTPQQFAVLRVLLERADTVVTADELSRSAWGHGLEGNRSFMDSLMSRLRSDLRRLGLANVIHTVRGVGYRIPMPAERDESDPPAAALLPAMQTAVLLIDADLRVIHANPAAEELTGYRIHELRALPTVFLLNEGAEVPRREQFVQAAFRGEPAGWGRLMLRRKNGSHLAIVGALSPVPAPEGGVFAVLIEFHPDPPDGTGATG